MIGENEKLTKPFEIKDFLPSQIPQTDYEQLGLVDLMQGYGLVGDRDSHFARAKREFTGDDEFKRIYLAIENGKAVGSLVTRRWLPHDSGAGEKFWAYLKKERPDLFNETDESLLVADLVQGIAVVPDFRRQGIASNLLRYAVQKEKPLFVVGGTKSPSQVKTRITALNTEDYETFYGNYRFDSVLQSQTADIHKPVMSAFLQAAGKDNMFYTSFALPADVPRTQGFPEGIIQSFQPLIKEQTGKEMAIIQPLLSVKKGFYLQ